MGTDKDDLAALFAEARRDATPGPDLSARVLADALAVQAGPPAEAGRGAGWVMRSLGAIGGWPGLSGLAVAGVAGLMIGVYATDSVDLLLNGQLTSLTGGDSTGLMPGIDSLLLSFGEEG
ncbi:hypothetical protein E2K80_18770 [Rhodophyticola sp. CCM32]|uniref:hypothetical protein n=1 Tax=Rhodophyticola sp. CCM32 TaxID=2916397 RepID=UPI00107FA495|nr:hypothetical protein [Rhodophyticola sp. CCM32]QBY02529.1 hypothetical protein E2K80_18770 [Rhodophyticola sp. CCM32]